MAYQSTDVYRYLIYLEKYLLGDLELFHQNAKIAEEIERKIQNRSKNKGCRNFFIKKTSSTNLIQTTKYPYSFEFMIGSAVVPRSTIPNTATLFATIDVLGYLTRTGTDYINTTKNFKEFFAYPSTFIDQAELTVLIKVYRHGMTHNYLPKLKMEISYHSSNPTNKLFFKNSIGDLVLNVNRLEILVINRLSEIINTESLFPNMDSQHSYMIQEYENQCRSSITNLLAIL
ncbi:hypothetical protein [Mariniphaga sp.]|uniref:hypothetical protein n=1 Tax=Mariniphaga sp. TaxID=1954475 RepID=UPI00356179A5